jgi:alpha/beta superfamily hydrolase
MVLAGQYLERPTLIARVGATDDSSGITLEGLYHRGSTAPAIVICAPHPRLGGSMDSAVVAELAWALTRSGRATLRFNYQGVGASGGTIVSGAPDGTVRDLDAVTAEADDAWAAVKHLSECVPHGRVAVVGYSFGAAVALQVARKHPEISHVGLIAPPTALFDFSAIATLPRPLFVAAGQLDALVDRPQIAGWVQEAADAHWEVLKGSDHAFVRGLTDLGKLCVEWFDRRA